VHEVKHDGYRLIVRREREAVRLFTRRLEPLRRWNPLSIEASSDASVI
jgi:ATP-dependent DNA ligase